jgi:hypothetical protein
MELLTTLSYYLGIPWRSEPASRIDRILNRRAWVVLGSNEVSLHEKVLTRKAIQILAGCPAGGVVHVDARPDAASFTVQHPKYLRKLNLVEIQLKPDGYILYLDYIWFKDGAPKGLGAIVLLRMAQVAQVLGIKRIELLAAGGTGEKRGQWTEDFWGYEFWPRLGFDAPLHYTIRQKLSTHPTLAHATKVSEVVLSDLKWWKQHGDGWEMTFDLTEGSTSWYTLTNYLSSREGLML